MSKNPILNAGAAFLYICGVAGLINWLTRINKPDNEPFFGPVLFLSLFTLSAAMMGYIFALNPIQLFLDGEKKQAVRLFIQTILSFAVLTLVVATLFLTGAIGR
jgi:hypothetical protein